MIQPQRRIPFARRVQLEELLIELEEADVIERVEGPTNWVSNIVITPKSAPVRYVCMNVDMTAVNKAIKRTRHVIPTVEELRYQMNGSAFFSKLDINHAPDSQPKMSVGEEHHIISFPDFPINDKSDKDLQLTCTVPTTGERQDLSGQHQEQDQDERQLRRSNRNRRLPVRYDDYLME